jgi:hypothetical protein
MEMVGDFMKGLSRTSRRKPNGNPGELLENHRAPGSSDHSYNGSHLNVMMDWEEVLVEPWTTIVADDPATRAIYARDKDLLGKPGWKRLEGIASGDKKMLGQGQLAPRYQYEALFGTKPKQIDQFYRLPLERGDHSGMETTELLDANYMQTYQYLIPVGSMQWAMPLGLLYTPIGMKKRATVETALNGSECARSQTCVKLDIGLRSPLRYLETPIYNKACMLRKNRAGSKRFINSTCDAHRILSHSK